MKVAIIIGIIILLVIGAMIFWPIALVAMFALIVMVFYKSFAIILGPAPVRFVFIVIVAASTYFLIARHAPNSFHEFKQKLSHWHNPAPTEKMVQTELPVQLPAQPEAAAIASVPTETQPAATQNYESKKKTTKHKRSFSKKDFRNHPDTPTDPQIF